MGERWVKERTKSSAKRTFRLIRGLLKYDGFLLTIYHIR